MFPKVGNVSDDAVEFCYHANANTSPDLAVPLTLIPVFYILTVLYVPCKLVFYCSQHASYNIRIDIFDSCERFPGKWCILSLSTLCFYRSLSRGLTVQRPDLL